MDDDLELMSHDELLVAARRMREAIRVHRDASGQDLCWHHPAMWDLLPGADPARDRGAGVAPVHAWLRPYRTSLDTQAPEAPRMTREFGEGART